MEEESSAAELISPRISFSHDLATFSAAAAATCPTTPGRSDSPSFMSRRRRRLPEPEFDFANAAADDVAPADRLFADGKLLPLPPLPPTPNARCVKQPAPPTWQKTTTRPPAPAPARSWGSPFARSSSFNSAASASGRFTCPAFPLKRSQSAGHRPHCKKVAPATTATAAGVHSGGGGGVTGGRSVYYYGYGSGRNGGGGGVRVSPVLNVTSIGTSVVNMLSYLLCDCGEIKGATKNRGFGVNCWVTR
uniref:Uncharacterized protein n=1 Tax=Avena sativa TaxID=4498 RepID=A0ACD5VDJ6_AVESA